MRTVVVLILDLVLPHGGQDRARRNAWAGLVENHTTAIARREAERVFLEKQTA